MLWVLGLIPAAQFQLLPLGAQEMTHFTFKLWLYKNTSYHILHDIGIGIWGEHSMSYRCVLVQSVIRWERQMWQCGQVCTDMSSLFSPVRTCPVLPTPGPASNCRFVPCDQHLGQKQYHTDRLHRARPQRKWRFYSSFVLPSHEALGTPGQLERLYLMVWVQSSGSV